MKLAKVLALLALCAAMPSAFAQGAPATVSFVARLQDAGLPLMGSHDFVFALYDQPTAGSNYWQETRSGVTVGQDGMLYLDLGTVTPLTSTVFSGNARYLEITIDGTVTTPRLLIESVPYSLRAGKASDADALQGHPSAFFQQAVASTCSGTSSIQTVNPDGSVTCTTGPLYTAGTGLALAGGIFSVDYTATQKRVTGTCTTGAVNAIAADGTVTCATIPAYTAGTGITIATNTISVDFTTAQHALTSACLAGGILNTFTAAGVPTCYGLAASGGLAFNAGNYSVDTTVIQPKITPVATESTSVSNINSNGYTSTGTTVQATIPASGNALVTVTASIAPTTNNALACVSASGGGVASSDQHAVCSDIAAQTIRSSATFLMTGLSTGTQTFTVQARTTGGHAVAITNPAITVVPMP